ncbi:hypothetical protein ACFQZ4_40040 [Catellatospora coxensis]
MIRFARMVRSADSVRARSPPPSCSSTIAPGAACEVTSAAMRYDGPSCQSLGSTRQCSAVMPSRRAAATTTGVQFPPGWR